MATEHLVKGKLVAGMSCTDLSYYSHTNDLKLINMELTAYYKLSAEQKNDSVFMYGWFLKFKELFDQIDGYEGKLQFWYDEKGAGLEHLVYILNHTEKRSNGVSGQKLEILKRIYLTEGIELITILPQGENEFRLYFWKNVEWGVNNRYKQIKDTNAEVIINTYWKDIRTSLSPKDLLKIEIDRVEDVILRKYPDKTSDQGILFHKGYNSTMRGKDAVSEFYNDDVAPIAGLKYYYDSDSHFIHLARGIANATLKVFFAEQAERMNQGEDIRIPTQVSPLVAAINKSLHDEELDEFSKGQRILPKKTYNKIVWNGSQKQLAELFVILRERGWIGDINATAIQQCFTNSDTIGQVIKPGFAKGIANYEQIYTPKYVEQFDNIKECQKGKLEV